MSDAHDSSILPELTPLPGGWSGRTFLAEVAGERTVVRLHPPAEVSGPAREAAVVVLARRVLGDLVPAVLETRAGDPLTDRPGMVVTEHLPGERGDVVLPTLDDDGLDSVARSLADVVARLSGAVQPRAGRFTDASLGVGPWGDPYDGAGLVDLLEHWSADLALPSAEESRLRGVLADAQTVLDEEAVPCLVHGDLNAKNLLLRGSELTGVVDWEFAHAGHHAADLGNLIRDERRPAFVGPLLERYVEVRGGSPEDLLEQARCADLVALLELAHRHGQNPVADGARERLRAIGLAGDVHASIA